MSRVQQFTKQPVLFAPPAKQPHPASPLRRLARRLSRVFMGALGVTILSSAAFVAQAGEVPLSQDAEVRATSPDSLYGGRNSLAVRQAQLQQSLLQFDLAGYTGPVLNATLTLPITSVSREGSFEVRRLLSDWDEGTVNFNNRPAISSQLEASQAVIASDANRPLSIDVTAMVQGMIDDPANDYGFALVPAGNIYIKTRSGETANGPTLSVEVEGPPPPDPLVIENVFINGEELSVAGQNFDNGDPPFVSLSGIGILITLDSNASGMTAFLPAALQQDGDYLLTVTTGSGPGQVATFDLTIGAVGNQGPPGPQGPEGPQGPQGPQGDTGAQGVAGPIGPEGSAGATGPQGPQGDTGAQGAIGLTGAIGPEGSAGATGPQGPKGDTGAQGAMGSMGVPGLPGEAGAEGPAGPAGIAGPAGPIGPEGSAGATGPQGPAGTGLSGYVVLQQCFTIPLLQPGDTQGQITSCPAGKKILGGGGQGGVFSVIQRSKPNGDFGWQVVVKNADSVPRDANPLCVWAICANID